MQEILTLLSQLQLPHVTPVTILIAVGIVLLLLLLWRSGWRLKTLRKVKIGPVEAERFKSNSKRLASTQEAKEGGIAAGSINIHLQDNTFQGKVGDIGGIIVKSGEETDQQE